MNQHILTKSICGALVALACAGALVQFLLTKNIPQFVTGDTKFEAKIIAHNDGQACELPYSTLSAQNENKSLFISCGGFFE